MQPIQAEWQNCQVVEHFVFMYCRLLPYMVINMLIMHENQEFEGGDNLRDYARDWIVVDK